MEKKAFNWVIHVVSNGTCDVCGEEETGMVDYMCDAHTHGLEENFGHPELQFVLMIDPRIIGHILNRVGEMVANGSVFKDGDIITEVLEPPAKLKVFETTDSAGEPILRLVVPDTKYRWPEDSDECPYNLQYESPYRGPMN